MKKFIRKTAAIVYTSYALLMFVITMLIVFIVLFICTVFFKKKKDKIIYSVLRAWAAVWYVAVFIRHKTVYESDYDKNRQYIYVANHISYIDIPQLLLAVKRPVKILGRHDLAKIPVFGTIYKSATISVNRSILKDRADSFNQLKNELQKGVSVFLFPEGSFNESGRPLKPFHSGAFKLSAEMNIPIKPIVFPDTNKRLNYKSIFSLSPGISRSILLKEIYPNGTEANAAACLRESVYKQMELILAK